MSDHYISFVPTDPEFVPSAQAQESAVAALRLAFPLQEIESMTQPHIVFHDCGENFEEARCPSCGALVEREDWQGWMSADYSEDSGFRLAPFTMPCCSATTNLNELRYSWPQAFGRFALRMRDAGDRVSRDLLRRLEEIMECKLRVIYQMY